MTNITVDVKITNTSPLTATYKGSNDWVSDNGDIEVPYREEATITFNPVQNPPIPSWSFQSSWVTIAAISPAQQPPPGPVPGSVQSGSAVVIEDENTNESETDEEYKYTLYTTLGELDPRIINKPGG